MPTHSTNAADGFRSASNPAPGTGGGGVDELAAGLFDPTGPESAASVPAELPPAVAARLADAESEVAAAVAAVEAVAADLHRAADALLDPAAGVVNLTTSTLIGQVGLPLDATDVPFSKISASIIGKGQDGVIGAAIPLAHNGVNIPSDSFTMAGLLASSPVEWLPVVVPAFAPYMGVAAPATSTNQGGGSQSDPGHVTCEVDSTDPACTSGIGIVPPVPPVAPPPPEPPPVDPNCEGNPVGRCGPGFITEYLPGYSDNPLDPGYWKFECIKCVPTVPPPPEPPPPAPPVPPVWPGGGGSGGGGACCPTSPIVIEPPKVVVQLADCNGKPIIIQTGGPGGSGGAGGTGGQGGTGGPGGSGGPYQPGPLPPGEYIFEQPIDVNVNVPPPTVTIPQTPSQPPSTWGATKPLTTVLGLDWSSVAACRAASFQLPPLTPPPPPPPTKSKTFRKDWTIFGDTMLGRGLANGYEMLSDDLTPDVSGLARSVFDYNLAAQTAGQVARDFQGVLGTDIQTAVGYLGMEAAAIWSERQTGVQVSYYTAAIRYAMQYLSPQYIPPQGDLDLMNTTGVITNEEYECLTRANGNIPGWRYKAMASRYTRPDPQQVTQLYLRGFLSEGDYVKRMREDGVVNVNYVDDYKKLAQQYPGLPDQMRFMVRDAFDEEIVKQYQYDKDFDEKFTARAQQLAAATGVPAEFFKLFWRSHWQIPSYTELTQMFHRLRKDRTERSQWEQDNPQGDTESDWDYHHRGPLVITLEDVQKALEVNDFSPGFVDPMIAITYRPITNSDAARAYQIGTLDRSGLRDALRTNGYSWDDAQTLVDFYDSVKSKSLASGTGVLTLRKISEYYKTGAIDRNGADAAAKPSLPDSGQRAEWLDQLDLTIAAEQRSAQIKLLQKRFNQGWYDQPGVVAALVGVGVSIQQSIAMGERWNDQRNLKSREVTAKQLCQWYGHHLIDMGTYFQRLLYLGYSPDDALKIAGVCKSDADAALAKKLAADAKAAAKAADKSYKVLWEQVKTQLKETQAQLKACNKALVACQSGKSPPKPPPPPPFPTPPPVTVPGGP